MFLKVVRMKANKLKFKLKKKNYRGKRQRRLLKEKLLKLLPKLKHKLMPKLLPQNR